MKQIIIILATVVLGVYICNTIINGSTGSLQSGADNIVKEVNEDITEGLIN